MTIVRTPYGILRFPEGMTQEQWQPHATKFIQQQRDAVNPAAEAAKVKQYNKLESFARGATQTPTLGLADEAMSGIAAGAAKASDWFRSDNKKLFKDKSLSDLYNEAQQTQQATYDTAREQNPKSYLGGEIAGSLATGVAGATTGAGKAIASGIGNMPLWARAAVGAPIGAATASEYAAATAKPGERMQAAKDAAVSGAMVGAVAPLAAAGLSKVGKKIWAPIGRAIDARHTKQAVDELDDAIAQIDDAVRMQTPGGGYVSPSYDVPAFDAGAYSASKPAVSAAKTTQATQKAISAPTPQDIPGKDIEQLLNMRNELAAQKAMIEQGGDLTQAQQYLSEMITPKQARRTLGAMEATKNSTGVDLPIASYLPGIKQDLASQDFVKNMPYPINNGRLALDAKVLAQSPEATDIAQLGINRVGGQLGKAQQRAVNNLSNAGSAFEGASAMQQASQRIRETVVNQRKESVAGLYKEALQGSVNVNSLLKPVKAGSKKKADAIEQIADPMIRKYAKSLRGVSGFENMPFNSMEFQHQLQSMISQDAFAMAPSLERRGMMIARDKVRTALDKSMTAAQRETYGQAQKTWSDGAEFLKAFDSDPVGKVLKQTEDGVVSGTRRIMDSQPAMIESARKLFVQHGEKDAWDAAIKGDIINKLNSAVGVRSNLRDAVAKNAKQQANLVAALGRENANGFRSVLKTIDRYKNLKSFAGAGSDTQQKLAAKEALDARMMTRMGKSIADATKGLRGIGAAKNMVMNPEQALKELSEYFNNPEGLRELTNYLFTDAGKAELERIAKAGTEQERKALTAMILQNAMNKNTE